MISVYVLYIEDASTVNNRALGGTEFSREYPGIKVLTTLDHRLDQGNNFLKCAVQPFIQDIR